MMDYSFSISLAFIMVNRECISYVDKLARAIFHCLDDLENEMHIV